MTAGLPTVAATWTAVERQFNVNMCYMRKGSMRPVAAVDTSHNHTSERVMRLKKEQYGPVYQLPPRRALLVEC